MIDDTFGALIATPSSFFFFYSASDPGDKTARIGVIISRTGLVVDCF